MKRLLAVLVLAVAGNAWSQTLFSDPFDGSAIDSSKWNVNIPYSDSAVFLENGEVVFRNGGSLITKNPLPASTTLSGSFQFTGSMWDRFSINLRANGNLRFGTYGTYASDIYVEIQHTGGESGGPIKNVTISHDGVAHYDQSQFGSSGRFESNTLYNFKIEDTGLNINVYVDDFITPLVTATTSAREGFFLAIGNREGGGNGSWISNGSELRLESITIIPEPSSLSLLLVGGALLMAGRRRK